MPSETFLRLSKDKRDTLLKAAKKEFQNHLIEEVSINQIIKNAGISRGSFYMYFKDKEDLYSYLLKQFREDLYTSIMEELQKAKGDFLKASEVLFDQMLEFCMQEENKAFFQNVFFNLKYTSDKISEWKPSKEMRKKQKEEVLTYIDPSLYTLDREEILEAFGLVMIITKTSMTHIFMNPKDREKEKAIYKRRLHMLKYGICKKEEN